MESVPMAKNLGAAALAVLGIVATAYLGFHLASAEPHSRTLEENMDATTFGGTGENKKHLVANSQENADWWEWSYLNKYKPLMNTDRIKDHFKNIGGGYSKTGDTYLGKKCDDLYRKTKDYTDLKSLEENIKAFCSSSQNPNFQYPG